MDGFNTADALRKGETKLKSGLFCLDLKGAFDAIRIEVVLNNLIRLGAQPAYIFLAHQWLVRRELVARFRYDDSRVFLSRAGLPQGESYLHFYSRAY